MIVVILLYIMFNFGILGCCYKVFMGDVGSMLIGFIVIWILFEMIQGKIYFISLVIVLWIIVILLIDMVVIMYCCLCKGMSLFFFDCQYIYYLIMCVGFIFCQVFVLIIFVAVLFVFIGVLVEYFYFVLEWVMLVFFLLVFFFYGYCIKCVWKVVCFIKCVKCRLCRNCGGSFNLIK